MGAERALGSPIRSGDCHCCSCVAASNLVGVGAADFRYVVSSSGWPAVRAALKDINFKGWATAEVRGGDRERMQEIAERMNKVLDI